MSILRTADNGFDTILDAIFGSVPTTTSKGGQSSALQQEMAKQPTLGLSGPSKKDLATKPKPSEYLSKADQMEEGRMSSKVIRTQLVKGEKAAKQQKRFEDAERIRLEALLGRQAQEKMNKRKYNQLDSSSDGSDVEPTSKINLVQMTIQKNQEKINNNNNKKQPKLVKGGTPTALPNTLTQADTDLIDANGCIPDIGEKVLSEVKKIETDEPTELTKSSKKKNKNKRAKGNAHQQLEAMRQRQEAEDELVMLEAD